MCWQGKCLPQHESWMVSGAISRAIRPQLPAPCLVSPWLELMPVPLGHLSLCSHYLYPSKSCSFLPVLWSLVVRAQLGRPLSPSSWEALNHKPGEPSETLSPSVFDLNLVQSLGTITATRSHFWVASYGRYLLPHPQVPVRWGSQSRNPSGLWCHLTE